MRALWKRFGGRCNRREKLGVLAVSVGIGLLWCALTTLWAAGLAERNQAIYATWLALRGSGGAAGGSGVLLLPVDAALPREEYGRIVRRLLDAGATTVVLDAFFENEGPTPDGDFSLRATLEEANLCLAYRFAREGPLAARVLPHRALIDGFGPDELEPRMGFSVPGPREQVRPVWLALDPHGLKPERGFPYLGFDSPSTAGSYYALPVVALAQDRQTTPEELLLPMRVSRRHDLLAGTPVDGLQAWLNPQPLPSLNLNDALELPAAQLNQRVSEESSGGRLVALVGDRSSLENQGLTLVNLSRNNFLVPLGTAGQMALVLAAALWVGWLGSVLKPRGVWLGTGLLAGGLVPLNYWALAELNTMIPLVAPLLSMACAYAAVTMLHRQYSRRRHRQLLVMARDCCPAASQRPARDLTGLALDLRGYGWSDPAAVRAYLTAVKKVVEHFGGQVYAYEGGAQLTHFGPGQAGPACQAAAGLVAEAEGRNLPPSRLAVAPELRRLAGLLKTARRLSVEVLLEDSTEHAPTTPIAGTTLHALNVGEVLADLRLQGSFPWQPREPQASADLTVGGVFQHYRLLRLVGQGGMGRVFQAEDTKLQRLVALKVVTGTVSEGQSKRFLKEARAVARVHHPGIVAIYEVGLTPLPYLVMEYAQGRDLSLLLEEEETLPVPESTRLILRVLEALAVVHGRGIIHRDLKPSNIMVTPEGEVKLMDFGLARFTEESARLTKDGELCGTPRYMSPEHLDTDFGEVDAVSDLFAVAAVFYELLTGVTPVMGETLPMLLYDLIYGQPQPPHLLNASVPEDLSAACLKGLSKDKAARYQSAQEFAAALRALPSGRSGRQAQEEHP